MIIKLFSNQFDRVYFSAKNTVYGLKRLIGGVIMEQLLLKDLAQEIDMLKIQIRDLEIEHKF